MVRKPPLYLQETRFSCAPACLRMVLASLGIEKTEADLRALCDCTELGTSAYELIRAARMLGFPESHKYNLSFDELRDLVGSGVSVIAFVGACISPASAPEEHAVVVTEAREFDVFLLDPARGELRMSRSEFEAEWSLMRGLTILIA